MPCSRKDSVPEPARPEDSLVSVMHGRPAASSSTTVSVGGTISFPSFPFPCSVDGCAQFKAVGIRLRMIEDFGKDFPA